GSSEVATPQAGKRQPAICITEPIGGLTAFEQLHGPSRGAHCICSVAQPVFGVCENAMRGTFRQLVSGAGGQLGGTSRALDRQVELPERGARSTEPEVVATLRVRITKRVYPCALAQQELQCAPPEIAEVGKRCTLLGQQPLKDPILLGPGRHTLD